VSRNDIIAESENIKLLAAGRAGRERARPLECNYTERCYVELGAPGLRYERTNNKAPRCGACDGKLLHYGPMG
jgi:hypothetical protein